MSAYIVRFGITRLLGKFTTSDTTKFLPGASVIVRTDRGLEAGTVLRALHLEPPASDAEKSSEAAKSSASSDISHTAKSLTVPHVHEEEQNPHVLTDGEKKPVKNEPAASIESPLELETVANIENVADHAASSEILSYSDATFSDATLAFSIEGSLLRTQTPDDIRELVKIHTREKEEFQICERAIRRLQLAMHLIRVEHLFGGERVIVYYLADDRIDFRELVRVLAGEFQTRVEMRQIGVRDEAKLLSDYGDCGKVICCNTHLVEIPPVSMKMAKLQKATLDPTKISGRCGRLKCCLRYEYDMYEEMLQSFPPIGSRVQTPDGPARVIGHEILTEQLCVEMCDERRRRLIALRDVQPWNDGDDTPSNDAERGHPIEDSMRVRDAVEYDEERSSRPHSRRRNAPVCGTAKWPPMDSDELSDAERATCRCKCQPIPLECADTRDSVRAKPSEAEKDSDRPNPNPTEHSRHQEDRPRRETRRPRKSIPDTSAQVPPEAVSIADALFRECPEDSAVPSTKGAAPIRSRVAKPSHDTVPTTSLPSESKPGGTPTGGAPVAIPCSDSVESGGLPVSSEPVLPDVLPSDVAEPPVKVTKTTLLVEASVIVSKKPAIPLAPPPDPPESPSERSAKPHGGRKHRGRSSRRRSSNH